MKYSIITINYNNKDGLRRTIESVVNQTCQDFEYIIIDGGSTDGSVEVIKEYEARIDYWVSEPDKGIYNAMNKGILKAQGEFLNFMNSGDCFYDKEVLNQIAGKLLSIDILTGIVCNKDSNNKIHSFSRRPLRVSIYYFFVTTLAHQSSFIRRTLFDNHPYDETLQVVADWKFFLECAMSGNVEFVTVNNIVASCEPRGASADFKILLEEKDKVLRTAFPYGVYKDYNTLSSRLGDVLIDELLDISQHKFLNRCLIHLLKLFHLIAR